MIFQNDPNYNCRITRDDGSDYYVFADWLWNNDATYYKGWSCEAGYTRFYIDKNFDVWSCMAQNTYLGPALADWSTENTTICQKDNCSHCTDDLLTVKQAPAVK